MTRSTSPDLHESDSRLSRRDFLVAAGSGTVLTAAAAATVVFQESTAYAQRRWDRETDVVVVGSGAAASSAALFAHEGKANVLMLEKAALHGGTTRRSGAGYWIPNNYLMREKDMQDPREDALRYMARTAYPTLYNPDHDRLGLPANEYELIETYYDNASSTVDGLRAMGVFDKHGFFLSAAGDVMPDYYAHLPENKAPFGRTLITAYPDGRAGDGVLMANLLRAGVEARKIPLLFEHRAARLVMNRNHQVIGIEATTRDARTVTIRANKGVIFGSGGFTANPDLCLNFLRGPIFGGCSVPTAEGDFVHIGAAAGAKLANMAHAWWWPVILEQALQFRSVPTGIGSTRGDSIITVNRYGRRVVNEKGPYNERTQAHFYWDPQTFSYPNLILFTIYDQFTRERFGDTTGLVLRPGMSAPYVLSGQTLEGLAAAMEKRLGEIANRTGNFRLDPSFVTGLKETIVRFNGFAETGKDLDFHRGESPLEIAGFGGVRQPGNDKPNKTLFPIRGTGPYYAVMTGAGTLDTKGGPKINAKAQVLDMNEKPIPGLYGAGNCVASPAGQAYWAAGGTLGPALTFGALAGRHAAQEKVKEES